MVDTSKAIFKKKPDESFEEYCHRIAQLKDEIDGTWTTIASIINDNTGFDYSADKYRKTEKRYLKSQGKDNEINLDMPYNILTGKNEEPHRMESIYSPYFDKESVTTNYEKNETTSSREIPLTEEQIKNPSELLKAHGFNPEEFELKTATNNKTTRMTPNGDTYVYSSRITIKPKANLVSVVEQVAESLKDYKSPKISFSKNNYKSNEYLVLPIYDLHWGRLPDTEDFVKYDIEEEKNKIISHIQKYIDKFNGRKFKTIYLVIGQDFFNSSFTGYTSSQSHLQSNAIDYRTMFRSGSELMIDIINMFGEICNNLEVVCSLGNHSSAEEFSMFLLLKSYYRTVKNINVDEAASPRKYYKIGNCGVGFGHADKEHKRIFGLMQTEGKDVWTNTQHHIFIAGHLHHFSVQNENGMELYRVPAICPADRWTVENGYVMNEPKTMCFIFDEEEGLTETHFMYL